MYLSPIVYICPSVFDGGICIATTTAVGRVRDAMDFRKWRRVTRRKTIQKYSPPIHIPNIQSQVCTLNGCWPCIQLILISKFPVV